MRPLLWKEMRELRPQILAWAAAGAAVELSLLTHVFDGSFVMLWTSLMPFAMFAAAIGLGVRQIAGERHARTLDFLLVRPVAARTVIWSKFLAGSVVLALLVTGAVALGYAVTPSIYWPGMPQIQDVRMSRLLITLFPRIWCLYALVLLFSVLVDRASKAWALAGVLVVTLSILAASFLELAPFSAFVYWLPFFESSGGLMEAAENWRVSGMTGLVFAAGALLLTVASAKLLERSPERYLGNAAVAASVAGVIAVAIVSANAAANRLPELAPAGSWEWSNVDERKEANILASGSQVALSMEERVRFLDFTDPARPREVADVATPLWQSLPDRSLGRATMEGGILYRVGQKKQLPVDDLEIAIVRPTGPSDAISLGPVRPGDFVSAPVPVPPFVFVAISREGSSSLRAFDITSKREVASLVIDRVADSRPQPAPWQVQFSMQVQLVRRGAHLYIGSFHYLTTLDITDPSKPAITSQFRPHGKTHRMYGISQPLASQNNRLLEFRTWGETMTSYDLHDPAHPVEEDDYFCRNCMPLEGSGRALYRRWQGGVMEFGVGRGGPHAGRYLPAYRVVSSFVASGDFVYVLTGFDMNQHRKVQAFNVAK